MKLFDENMQIAKVGNFAFSGVRPDKLGAVEYTLVTVVMDKTGSVFGHSQELLDSKIAVVGACKKSPRAEFLLFRNTEFNQSVDEVHGFVELAQIDTTQYQAPDCHGMTALFDATYSAVAATNEYAKTLSDAEFQVNGIVFVVTDGDDNQSIQTEAAIAAEMKRGVQNEWIESLNVVLIGVNAQQYQKALKDFTAKAQLTQYVDVGDATPQRLAKLADFVSRSISSQSQALGTGGPSQALTF
jgi:uncharacterized protein YegL